MNLVKQSSYVALAALLALGVPQIVGAADPAPLKVSGGEAARGVQQVAIGAFNVGFIFQSVDQTKAVGGFMGLVEGTTRAESSLVGITPQMMQAITDAAYADFVAKLTAAGYTVAPTSGLFSTPLPRAHPETAPLDINLALEKKSTGKATFLKPSALPVLYLIPGDFTGSGMSSIGLNMSSAQTNYAFSQYAKQAGVGVVDVVYLIDFSDQKRPGAWSMGSLKVTSGVSVASNYSRASLIAPSGKTATVKITDSIPVEGDFATMRDTTSGTSKAVATAGHVLTGLGRLGGRLGGLGALGGLGGSGNTRKTEFDANPENYRAGATQAAALANARIVNQLAALR